MSTRLSITLTDSQSAALERIAAETGATKQSMIGLAISAWIAQQPQGKPQGHWFGWCRTLTEGRGSRDVERKEFDTEHDAIMHAKEVTRRMQAEGIRDARPMWEQCDENGVPVWLI